MLKLIASALKRNEETPNVELAEKLAGEQDTKGIAEIVSGLTMDKATANDCIKVLYEIGERSPNLILPYAEVFLDLLKSKNNRLVWGGMTALNQITALCPDKVFHRFEDVVAAYQAGSVITVDNSMSVFAKLCRANPAYEEKILPILIHHFENCRAKEIPQHMERVAGYVTPAGAAWFQAVIGGRYGEMTEAQKARVNKAFRIRKSGQGVS